jgi:hypothetical protein
MCRSKKLTESEELPASTGDEPDAPTCSKCCEKDDEIAGMRKEIERLSNELCQARMQSKFDMIKSKEDMVSLVTSMTLY